MRKYKNKIIIPVSIFLAVLFSVAYFLFWFNGGQNHSSQEASLFSLSDFSNGALLSASCASNPSTECWTSSAAFSCNGTQPQVTITWSSDVQITHGSNTYYVTFGTNPAILTQGYIAGSYVSIPSPTLSYTVNVNPNTTYYWSIESSVAIYDSDTGGTSYPYYLTMGGRYTVPTGTITTGSCCVPTGWTPDISGTCSDQTMTQTSNCGTTRTVYGGIPAASGQCGTASTSGSILSSKPTSDLCALGSASDPQLSGNSWCWNCSGICGGSSVSCCATRDSNWKEVKP